jgi:ABC-type branched-subunit amino acid transport system ATPase component
MSSASGAETTRTAGSRAPGLEVTGMSVRYGGGPLVVEGVSLTAASHEVTGLIGPNGAGKTTLFNAVCGTVPIERGRVRVFGEDVTGKPAFQIARRGLSRTFQILNLVEGRSVLENVALGREARLSSRRLISQLISTRGEDDEVRRAAQEAVELCGLRGFETRDVSSLSTGQRRLVELARVVAGGFPVLLLDEPSSGLDSHETARLGKVVAQLVRERGATVLLVEHDMSLVQQVCRRVYVMDYGKLIFSGAAAELVRSDAVRDAYLGKGDVIV